MYFCCVEKIKAMCSYIDMTNVPEGGFTADEDIVCYKVMEQRPGAGFMLSLHKEFGYLAGETYVSGVAAPGRRVSRRCRYNKHTNSLSWVTCAEKRLPCEITVCDSRYSVVGNDVRTGLSMSAAGTYSYTHYMNGEMVDEMRIAECVGANPVVVRCRIPRGSRYYVSDDGMTYVSDMITIDRIVGEPAEKVA